MEASSPNFLSQGLKLVSSCPMCKKSHSTDPHIIDASDEQCLVHVTCSHCQHAILAVMNMQDVGVSCIGIMTDLSREDTESLLEGGEVNIDDVLMTHELLDSERFLANFSSGVKAGSNGKNTSKATPQ